MEPKEIDEHIVKDLGTLIDDLVQLGYVIVESQYASESFGNWSIAFSGKRKFFIVKDRGEIAVESGDRDSLMRCGLWPPPAGLDLFRRRLISWAEG